MPYTYYMFIQVKLLNGWQELLWYKISSNFQQIFPGTIVQVPLRNRIVPAIVVDKQKQLPSSVKFKIKDACGVEPFPQDFFYNQFIEQLSCYYQIDTLFFIKRLRYFLQQKEEKSLREVKQKTYDRQKIVTLTPEQKVICNFLLPYINKPTYLPVVLHGVTGSGKTEVYKQLIAQTIANNKTVVFLLPEITLAFAFERRLKQELSGIVIYGFHSGIAKKEKKRLWQQLIDGKPVLIIGVHLPIVLPITNLGLIIIDEEHAVNYQEKKHPKVNSKEAALLRAKLYNIPIILGSATPSFTTLHNVRTKKWHFFQLKKRFSGAFPQVQTVLLTNKKGRKNFWISKQLEDAINQRLIKKEQTIIFINRRGFSFFVQCKLCSFIFLCAHCSVSLTLHENNRLLCHYCEFGQKLPSLCPGCKATNNQLLKKGIGTQKVVTILENLFPQATIARADLDTTMKKKQWQQMMQDFSAGTIDILVGTQTITKGLHFPRVTLVGILWADLHFHFPIFNATETAIQQLIQVAGRAGRNHENSLVIVQAMQDYAAFSYLNESDYLVFYKQEVQSRKALGYPPYKRLVEIELKFSDEAIVEHEAAQLMRFLQLISKKEKRAVQILGPARPPVSKIKNIYMRKLYLKGNNINDLIFLFQIIKQENYTSTIFFTPNPVS